MRVRPSWFVTAGLAAAAACGSGNGSSSSSSNANQNQVMISDYQFSPPTLTIKAGTTVTWVNQGPSTHQVTSDSMVFSSSNLAAPMGGDPYYGGGGMQAASFSFTFATPGTYEYHCGNHPPSMGAAYAGFTGSIVVNP